MASLAFKYRSLIGLPAGIGGGALMWLVVWRRGHGNEASAPFIALAFAYLLLYVVPRLLDPAAERRRLGLLGVLIGCSAAFLPWWAGFVVVAASIWLGSRVQCEADIEPTMRTGSGKLGVRTPENVARDEPLERFAARGHLPDGSMPESISKTAKGLEEE